MPLLIKRIEYAVELTPDQIVLLLLHAQEVDGVSVRNWYHLDGIEVFQEGDARALAVEVDVTVDTDYRVFKLVGDHLARRGKSGEVVRIEAVSLLLVAGE